MLGNGISFSLFAHVVPYCGESVESAVPKYFITVRENVIKL
jgi:hypothetical protein